MKSPARHEAVPSADERGAPASPGVEPGGETRRAYRRPRLVEFGDVRDLTFGMTPGLGDSGNPAIFKPRGL